MSVTRKVSWILAILLQFCLINQITAQAGPPNGPPSSSDSLFKRVNLEPMLPLGDNLQPIFESIKNRAYTKNLTPVHVSGINNHLLRRPEIELEIPGLDSHLTFRQNRIKWSDSTNYTWRGATADSLFRLKIVMNNDKLTGTFMTDTASYRLRPIGQFLPSGLENKINLHVLTRLDPTGLNLTDSLRQRNGQGQKVWEDAAEKKHKTMVQDSITDQGIMVIYSDNVADEVADPEALVQSAVDDANSAYDNSGVSVDLTLVHTREVNYDESGDTDRDLQRLEDSTDGYIDNIHQLRLDYGADIVVLLTADTQSDQSGTVTGEAYEIMADSSTAFAVVRYDFAEAPVYTLAHEVGHLQGADHNPQDEVNPHASYGHGYTYEEGEWRTIMAYDINACCSRIEFFSTPDVKYNGDPLGTSSESDNARLISETAPVVADFLPPYPLEVQISGPSFVHKGHTGEWNADVSGGQTPYSYEWYKRNTQEEAWSLVDQGTSYSQQVNQQFTLKLEAYDANGDNRESRFTVYTDVNSSTPGQTERPQQYRLNNNYPNPFNPSTQISYFLPEVSDVSVAVFTVTGQHVRTLVEERQISGKHTVTFNAGNLSSGLYILRMKAHSNAGTLFNKSIKMTLMK